MGFYKSRILHYVPRLAHPFVIGLTFRTGDAVRLRYAPDQPARFLLVAELGNGSRYARLHLVGALLAGLWF